MSEWPGEFNDANYGQMCDEFNLRLVSAFQEVGVGPRLWRIC